MCCEAYQRFTGVTGCPGSGFRGVVLTRPAGTHTCELHAGFAGMVMQRR